jgi:hypothetical protein
MAGSVPENGELRAETEFEFEGCLLGFLGRWGLGLGGLLEFLKRMLQCRAQLRIIRVEGKPL